MTTTAAVLIISKNPFITLYSCTQLTLKRRFIHEIATRTPFPPIPTHLNLKHASQFLLPLSTQEIRQLNAFMAISSTITAFSKLRNVPPVVCPLAGKLNSVRPPVTHCVIKFLLQLSGDRECTKIFFGNANNIGGNNSFLECYYYCYSPPPWSRSFFTKQRFRRAVYNRYGHASLL